MKPIAALLLLTATGLLHAQVIDPKETARDKATDRTNNAIDRGIDRTLDRAEQGLKNLFRRKDKNKDTAPKPAEPAAAANAAPAVAAGAVAAPTVAAGAAGALKAYSKFDFVPGEQVVAFEDFSQDTLGDFPARWNTNAGGEVVRIDGQPVPWLKLPDRGLVYPEFVQALPENFTMEFDMMVSDDLSDNLSGLRVHFPTTSSRTLNFDPNFGSDTQAGFDLHPVPSGSAHITHTWVFDKAKQPVLENSVPLPWKLGGPNRVSIWRQKTRVRLYINESKVWDLPRAFDPTLSYSMLMSTQLFAGAVYVSNLRIAVGAPDMRNKLITEGRFVTRGILFDVNADRIKPESYSVLKEIAAVLKDNAAVQVQIVGHTDSDGEDARNLDLSKRRAEAVKAALAGEFGIAAERMAADGKGESQPAEPNTTPQGKANNRRVEFIRR
jgi:OOP family OmpA-OmpF porin